MNCKHGSEEQRVACWDRRLCPICLDSKNGELREALEQHSHKSGPFKNQCCWCDETLPDHKQNCLRQEALEEVK